MRIGITTYLYFSLFGIVTKQLLLESQQLLLPLVAVELALAQVGVVVVVVGAAALGSLPWCACACEFLLVGCDLLPLRLGNSGKLVSVNAWNVFWGRNNCSSVGVTVLPL